jgi:hypothetical protein
MVKHTVTRRVDMGKKVDSWHQVGAGGSDVVEQLSAAAELRLLMEDGGSVWGQDPAVLLELAECGQIDCLRGGE